MSLTIDNPEPPELDTNSYPVFGELRASTCPVVPKSFVALVGNTPNWSKLKGLAIVRLSKSMALVHCKVI